MDIENQIRNFHLTFLQIRDNRVEWQLKFPMFVDTFNRLVSENDRVPSQEEFVEKYFQFNDKIISDVISDPKLKLALEARIRRTYPSLVRDLHFEAFLREKGLVASYDQQYDVERGIDHLVQYKGHTFNVHCFVSTAAGEYGRRLKNGRHHFQGSHINIRMDLTTEGSKKVGDFYLYSDKQYDYLIEQMENELIKDNTL
jgi:hypothetical protein